MTKRNPEQNRLGNQDPALRKLLWPAGAAVNVLGIAFGWVALNGGFMLPWANWISLLSLLAALVLYLRFPVYFTIFEEQKAGDQRCAVGLYPVVLMGPVSLMGAACADLRFLGWWKAWVMGGILVVLLAVALWRFVPEFRFPVRAVSFILVGTLLSPGLILNVDALLDGAPADVISREVAGTRSANGKSGPSWYLTVKYQGKDLEFAISEDRYENTVIGDRVQIAIYDGFLGIPYGELEN